MSEEKSLWKWPSRFREVIELLTVAGGLAATAFAWFSGVTHGEAAKQTLMLDALAQLESATPSNLRERMAPIYATIRTTTEKGAQTLDEARQRAQTIANAVTNIPTETFSSGSSRIFSITEQGTALVCGDRFHISYVGSTLQANVVRISFEGGIYAAKIGVTARMPNGTRFTLMRIENKNAVLDVDCESSRTSR